MFLFIRCFGLGSALLLATSSPLVGENSRVNVFATFCFKCLALGRIFNVQKISELITTGGGKLLSSLAYCSARNSKGSNDQNVMVIRNKEKQSSPLSSVY